MTVQRDVGQHECAGEPSVDRVPRALLEAAACGRPLIVTDVSGSRDFVRDGFEGLVVPPRDPAALADALARLASDRNQREQMGKAARTRFLDGFQEDHVKRGRRGIKLHNLLLLAIFK